jgi:hypothetical protein
MFPNPIRVSVADQRTQAAREAAKVTVPILSVRGEGQRIIRRLRS